MSLPPVNATTVALNNSAPGTTELFGKMILGVGIGGAVICLGAVIYSKVKGAIIQHRQREACGMRHTRRVHHVKNGTRKA